MVIKSIAQFPEAREVFCGWVSTINPPVSSSDSRTFFGNGGRGRKNQQFSVNFRQHVQKGTHCDEIFFQILASRAIIFYKSYFKIHIFFVTVQCIHRPTHKLFDYFVDGWTDGKVRFPFSLPLR